jgi:hypothetical protein
VITPIPVTDETALEYLARWDYMVSERLSMTPVSEADCILFCIDLGVEPESTREFLSVTVDGLEIDPCSTLARPFYPADHVPGQDTLFILRDDPFQPDRQVYLLEDMNAYRERFESDDEFRSAVPGSARIYTLLCDIHANGEPFDIEVVYIVRGWTWLDGGIPLEFTLFQPALWEGRVEDGSFLLDLSAVPDREDWVVEFMYEYIPVGQNVRLRLEDYELAAPEDCPVLVIVPSDIEPY